MIEIRDVQKIYRMGDHQVFALKGVSLKIEDGDFVAIMGPSGSGKSTLTHILGLLDVPTSGSYLLNGREVAGLSEDELAEARREELGFIFQQFNLLPRMSAKENVALPLLYSRKNSEEDRASDLLAKVGLEARGHHRPNEMSGGQQQRVAIARSLINLPRVILADEPTGNLDSQSEKEIMKVLRDLNAQGITIIIVTHEEEIGLQAKRLIRMRDGVIQSDERLAPRSAAGQTFSKIPSRPSNLWSELLEHFRQGFKTLAANKIRTALSLLGILIGVAAVIAMLALGRGAQKSIESQLSSLGSNVLTLRAGAMRMGGVAQESGATTRLTPDDATALEQKIPEVVAIAPSVNQRAQATYLNKNWSTQVLATSPGYARMRAAEPAIGRFFTTDENLKRSRVAIIGLTVVRELFGASNPIGEMIKLNKVSFQVIGILPEKGSNGWRDQDDTIVIPLFTGMHRLMGKDYVDSIDIQIGDGDDADRVQESILDLMYSRHRTPLSMRDQAYEVRNMAEIQAAVSQSSRTMTVLLASIAAISLLVGGIGIMNIMLVSVTERTKEIGLRKAIGAKRRDILMQFLAESVVVSVIGGLLGVALGWAITLVLANTAGWPMSVTADSVLLAFFFSSSIGVVFGIYPARKASRLNPIDALRYE